MPPTFLEIAGVTLENNAAQKNFLCHAPPSPQIQFPFYGSAFLSQETTSRNTISHNTISHSGRHWELGRNSQESIIFSKFAL